jgi:hypothetical protein
MGELRLYLREERLNFRLFLHNRLFPDSIHKTGGYSHHIARFPVQLTLRKWGIYRGIRLFTP